MAEGRRINVDFPVTAAKAFAATLAAQRASTKPFRFVYVSGIVAEKDQARTLWVLSEPRKLRVRASTLDLRSMFEG